MSIYVRFDQQDLLLTSDALCLPFLPVFPSDAMPGGTGLGCVDCWGPPT